MAQAEKSMRMKAAAALVLSTFLWGGTFVVVKDALAYSSVFLFLGDAICLGRGAATGISAQGSPGLKKEQWLAGADAGVFDVLRVRVSDGGAAIYDACKIGIYYRVGRFAGAGFAWSLLAKKNFCVGACRRRCRNLRAILFNGPTGRHDAAQSRGFVDTALRGYVCVSRDYGGGVCAEISGTGADDGAGDRLCRAGLDCNRRARTAGLGSAAIFAALGNCLPQSQHALCLRRWWRFRCSCGRSSISVRRTRRFCLRWSRCLRRLHHLL